MVLIATGLAKTDAIRGLVMDDAITTRNPSTMLKMHENVYVVIDQELADARGLQGLRLFCRPGRRCEKQRRPFCAPPFPWLAPSFCTMAARFALPRAGTCCSHLTAHATNKIPLPGYG